MNQVDLEYIVNLVTQQVMAAVEQNTSCNSPQTEGMPKALVVGGSADSLPEELCRDFVCLDLEDYHACRNILRYDRVVIASLNITQLADLAQGRISDDVTCAVIHALLNGIETVMPDGALSFRKYAGKGSTALYHLLESYAQTLQAFGVKTVSRKPKPVVVEAKPPKFSAPPVQAPQGTAVPNAGRLITETLALALVKEGGPVRLPQNAILTPSARDVFAQAGVALTQDN